MKSNGKTLKEEYEIFMKSYGFDKVENSSDWASASLGTPIKIKFPNIPARKNAVIYHDLNHIVTGFKAQTFVGEVQAAYFEIFSGCSEILFNAKKSHLLHWQGGVKGRSPRNLKGG